MSRKCGVCTWTGPDGTELPGWCPRCRGRTVADVADLPVLWTALGGVLAPGASGEGQRVSGSKNPPLPVRVDVANLRGPAGVGPLPGTDQVGAPSIATVLWCVRLAIRETCALPSELTGADRLDTRARVGADAQFVGRWLDRYAEKTSAENLAAVVEDIHATRQRAWRACGYGAHKVCLGPCPYVWDDGEACGVELWVDPVTDEGVRCRVCGTHFDRKYFLWLRRQAEEATA